MEKTLKFSFLLFLSLIITSTAFSKEIEGIFSGFNSKTLTVVLLTPQGKKEFKLRKKSKQNIEFLKVVRPGYILKLKTEGNFITELKLKEKPQ